ncbi:MAG TPA: hypothetical protein VFA68_02440 [Terriglobales bacterium]|nr:hypothetical protein [Terriglobales bacterium]
MKKLLPAIDSPSQHVLVGGNPERLLEQFRKVVWPHPRYLSQRRQRDLLVEVRFNKLKHSIDACSGKTIPSLSVLNRLHTITAEKMNGESVQQAFSKEPTCRGPSFDVCFQCAKYVFDLSVLDPPLVDKLNVFTRVPLRQSALKDVWF